MKAYEIHEFGIDALALVERAVPRPASGEVLVRLHSASLNYRDVMVVSGTYNPRMRRPSIPLSDGAGEVVEVGGDVTQWRSGDRVMPTVVQGWVDGPPTAAAARSAIGAGTDGVLREYACFDARSLVRMPGHLSYDEAAALPCAGVTAWNALEVSGAVKPGDTVLTLGTGGVSVFAVQIARRAGARVISTSSSDEKLDRIREVGADETINYRDQPEWDRAVLDLTEGLGVDHVIEVGGAGTLTRSVKAARVGGHIALIGALDTDGEFNPIPIFMKALRVQGIFVGSRRMLEDLSSFLAAGEIRPVIDRIFGFGEVREALNYMQSGSHFGKIVVRICD